MFLSLVYPVREYSTTLCARASVVCVCARTTISETRASETPARPCLVLIVRYAKNSTEATRWYRATLSRQCQRTVRFSSFLFFFPFRTTNDSATLSALSRDLPSPVNRSRAPPFRSAFVYAIVRTYVREYRESFSLLRVTYPPRADGTRFRDNAYRIAQIKALPRSRVANSSPLMNAV